MKTAHMMGTAMGTKVPACTLWVPGTVEQRMKHDPRPRVPHNPKTTFADLLTERVTANGLPSTMHTIRGLVRR